MAARSAERLVEVTEDAVVEAEAEEEDEPDAQVVLEVEDVSVESSVELVELAAAPLKALESNDEVMTLLIVLDMIPLLRKIEILSPQYIFFLSAARART